MRTARRQGLTGKLIFWAFIAIVVSAVGWIVLDLGRDPVIASGPEPVAPVYDDEGDGLLEAESPHYPGEGAAGILEDQENAGAAVNPITPTGRMGGPAGQTPAYGRPGGAPSRVVSQ